MRVGKPRNGKHHVAALAGRHLECVAYGRKVVDGDLLHLVDRDEEAARLLCGNFGQDDDEVISAQVGGFRRRAGAEAGTRFQNTDAGLWIDRLGLLVVAHQASEKGVERPLGSEVDGALAACRRTLRQLLEQGGFSAAARSRDEEGAVFASPVAHGEVKACEDVTSAKEEARLSAEDG